jgi:hypothetical protein
MCVERRRTAGDDPISNDRATPVAVMSATAALFLPQLFFTPFIAGDLSYPQHGYFDYTMAKLRTFLPASDPSDPQQISLRTTVYLCFDLLTRPKAHGPIPRWVLGHIAE